MANELSKRTKSPIANTIQKLSSFQGIIQSFVTLNLLRYHLLAALQAKLYRKDNGIKTKLSKIAQNCQSYNFTIFSINFVSMQKLSPRYFPITFHHDDFDIFSEYILPLQSC